ncbi:MAG: peptide chain release factor N(5)-glutamine methyltransferase [Fusobacteriaceae bacterium]
MKLLDILKFAEEYLSKYSFSKPRLEAETVISYVLKLDRLGLYTNFELELSEDEKDSIKKYLREMARKRTSFKDLEKVEEKDFRNPNLELLEKTKKYLEEKGVQDYKLDAEEIFSHVLGCKRSFLNIQLSKEIVTTSLDQIRKMTMLRGKDRKPIQQILGEWEFYGYPFKINENVLIPRADTEILVEQCKFLMMDLEKPSILDIGTGSGAISVTLAKELPNSKVIALDISEDALKLAKENAELNGAKNVEFRKSDVFSAVTEMFDLIVSNPPYIPIEEYNELGIEVKNHEPRLALTDNGDGYFFYEKISKEAGKYLKIGGYLAFEVGYNQSEKVSELMEKNKITVLKVVQDYCGKNRVVIGIKGGEEKDVNEVK